MRVCHYSGPCSWLTSSGCELSELEVCAFLTAPQKLAMSFSPARGGTEKQRLVLPDRPRLFRQSGAEPKNTGILVRHDSNGRGVLQKAGDLR